MKAIDKLRANWSKPEQDIMLHHPLGYETNRDAAFLSTVFNQSFTNEMKDRGYDITTLKFSIEPKAGEYKFSSTRLPEEDTE